MAPSFFSSKKPAGQKTKEEMPSVLAVVRTMQDDLDDIKRGKRDDAPQDGRKPPEPAFQKVPSGPAANPFSEAAEAPQSGVAGADKAVNPFGVPSRMNMNRPIGDFSQRPTLENGLTSMVPDGALIINEPKQGRKPLLIGIIAVFAVLVCLAGAFWYFTAGDLGKLLGTDPVPEVIGIPDVSPAPPVPKPLPFSIDKPNYLPIDTEVVSPEDIRTTLSQAAGRIGEADIASPVEFLVTDRNNNPLAFSRFAFLLGLDLDPELLALIDEPFALYAYDDSGRARLGLALTFTDVPAATALVTKTETALPYALRPLILEPDALVSQSLIFRSSAHDRFFVRFANIESVRGISIDYALDDDRWYIGTSKDTLRAILDAAPHPIEEAAPSMRDMAP